MIHPFGVREGRAMSSFHLIAVTGRSAALCWKDKRVCEICYDDITQKSAAARYCSVKCKQAGYRENVKRAKSNDELLVTR